MEVINNYTDILMLGTIHGALRWLLSCFKRTEMLPHREAPGLLNF
jgi:hypothetical protein